MASSRRSIVISIVFAALGGPGIALIWLPLWITRFRIPAAEQVWQIQLAALLILAGILPVLESVRRFVELGRGTLAPSAPTERLVVSGFYRYVRNPMYVGVLVALAGEILLFRSLDLVVFAALLCLGFDLFVCFYEEPTLTRRFGSQYLLFKSNVPRWFPRLRPWRGKAV